MNEALIQSYTLPYVKIIKKNLNEDSNVYLFTLEKKQYTLSKEAKNELKKQLKQKGIIWISAPYYSFGLKAFLVQIITFIRLFFLTLFKDISSIHAWCTPAGAIGWFLSVLTSKPLIIDSYEPHARAMVENGAWEVNSLAFRILYTLEKWQTQKAYACIGLTEKTPEYAYKEYGVKTQNYYLKPACVDTNLFCPDIKKDFSLIAEPQNCSKIIGIYAGKIGGIYLEREIFDFFKSCEAFWKDNFKAVLLTDTPANVLEEYIRESGMNKKNIWYGEVAYINAPSYLTLGTFALNPVKPVPSKRYCTSIKDGEYWAMGLPVVITPNISDDSDIIEKHNAGAIIKEFSDEGYMKTIAQIDTLLRTESTNVIKERIRKLAIEYRSYKMAQRVYKSIYSDKAAF